MISLIFNEEKEIVKMPKFFIEIPHEKEEIACLRAIKVLQETGSHFLTHADYGCKDGEHKAWIIVEANNKQEAENIIPRAYKMKSKVVQLNTFSAEEVEELLKFHQGNS